MKQNNNTSSLSQITIILLMWLVTSGCRTGRTSPYHPDRPDEIEEGVLHYEERWGRDPYGGTKWSAVYEKGFRGRKMAQQVTAYMERLKPVDHDFLATGTDWRGPDEINQLTDAQLEWMAQELFEAARAQRQRAAYERQREARIRNNKDQRYKWNKRAAEAEFRAAKYTDVAFLITDYLNKLYKHRGTRFSPDRPANED